MHKYPRTQHIEGSGLQPGDADLEVVACAELTKRFLVVEEKLDGANSGISFATAGVLQLQSRGHYLTGGPREKQFELFKAWANRRAVELWTLLGTRYVLYGEWLYARHSIFYTDLSHYFLEFDIYDQTENRFLSTERRRELLRRASFIVSVPVVYRGQIRELDELTQFIGKSAFIRDDHRAVLRRVCEQQKWNVEQALMETDPTGLMEGLYVKWEEDGQVKGRYKYVRRQFLQTVRDSGSHWLDRPIIPNQLGPGVELFA
jgi:hypothetical protein